MLLCDVLVEPLDNRDLEVLSARIDAKAKIRELDPWIALFKAIFHPVGVQRLRIGIDPGSTCAIAIYADNILVWVEKTDCRSIPSKIRWIINVTQPKDYIINIGSGTGYDIVAESLLREGIAFTIVPEEGTSRRQHILKLRGIVRDKDIQAAMTLALYYE
ncbi:MAG: hypothetical protein QXJ33_03250 [Acidilobaceae archaeon]